MPYRSLPPLRIDYARWRRVGPPSPTIKLLPEHPCPVCREPLGTHRRCTGCTRLIGAGHDILWMSGETCDDCRWDAQREPSDVDDEDDSQAGSA